MHYTLLICCHISDMPTVDSVFGAALPAGPGAGAGGERGAGRGARRGRAAAVRAPQPTGAAHAQGRAADAGGAQRSVCPLENQSQG